jgi:hypothetical protein
MFSTSAAIRGMLRDRRTQLTEVLARVRAGREYALRVYRVDSELAANVVELDPDLRRLSAEAASAPPGQQYLLRRKMDEQARNSVKATAGRLAGEIRDALASLALDSVVRPIPGTAAGDAPGTMVLNAAFLVPVASLPEWLETAGTLNDRYRPMGLRLDLTGPWPPYHFAGERE